MNFYSFKSLILYIYGILFSTELITSIPLDQFSVYQSLLKNSLVISNPDSINNVKSSCFVTRLNFFSKKGIINIKRTFTNRTIISIIVFHSNNPDEICYS